MKTSKLSITPVGFTITLNVECTAPITEELLERLWRNLEHLLLRKKSFTSDGFTSIRVSRSGTIGRIDNSMEYSAGGVTKYMGANEFAPNVEQFLAEQLAISSVTVSSTSIDLTNSLPKRSHGSRKAPSPSTPTKARSPYDGIALGLNFYYRFMTRSSASGLKSITTEFLKSNKHSTL